MIIRESAIDAFYKLTDSRAQITSYVFDEVRASVPKINLDDVFTSKEEIAGAIKEQLAKAMTGFGFSILQALVSSAASLVCQSKQKTANQPTNQSLTDNCRNENRRSRTSSPRPRSRCAYLTASAAPRRAARSSPQPPTRRPLCSRLVRRAHASPSRPARAPALSKAAMNEINAAQRMRLAAFQQAEADKIRVIKAAEADAESKFLAGQGIARQRQAIMAGLRESVTAFQGEVSDVTSRDVLSLMLLVQYFDTLKVSSAASLSCQSKQKTANQPTNQPTNHSPTTTEMLQQKKKGGGHQWQLLDDLHPERPGRRRVDELPDPRWRARGAGDAALRRARRAARARAGRPAPLCCTPAARASAQSTTVPPSFAPHWNFPPASRMRSIYTPARARARALL